MPLIRTAKNVIQILHLINYAGRNVLEIIMKKILKENFISGIMIVIVVALTLFGYTLLWD